VSEYPDTFLLFVKTSLMKFILRILLSALAVVVLAKVLPGVGVDTYTTAIIVAIVLSLLNFIVKPILIILTLPVTIITFGLFLLIINAIIILLADNLIAGFTVDSIWWALLFSLLLSFLQSILFSLLKGDKKN
jgi:putative membrane protein